MNENISRRHVGLFLAGLGMTPAHAQTAKPGTTIHQEVDFKTTADRIYQVLLDGKQFSACTHAPAEIQPEAGAAFQLFGGQIEGRNIELLPDKRVVQAWRSHGWTPGVYSIVRFELVAHGSGTRVVFDHTGFPEGQMEHLSQGWEEHYWSPLHKYLNA